MGRRVVKRRLNVAGGKRVINAFLARLLDHAVGKVDAFEPDRIRNDRLAGETRAASKIERALEPSVLSPRGADNVGELLRG